MFPSRKQAPQNIQPNNLGSIISKHNKQILNKDKVEVVPPCNCDTQPIQGYTGCPLENQQCKKESVIYTCKVTTAGGTETYTGLTGGQIKTRISQHTTDFKMKIAQHFRSKYTIWRKKAFLTISNGVCWTGALSTIPSQRNADFAFWKNFT